jgi:hypothetical protein
MTRATEFGDLASTGEGVTGYEDNRVEHSQKLTRNGSYQDEMTGTMF